ncbi:hypothetical protein E3T55_03865 [Cryobacterium frigoriphilum]|uniref:Polymerase nucleotidyl transferase domain-containing protein n=1 Tax=Cryobacterium frigoriphilum TaxID=1259150 RepID=A0A4R9A9G5_9MICO|nr:nucleotidyltransferase domain-containing protein [Cryobacterium frigoriphilum]TFD54561.1 hypothetical protein E3T55_03865 [Cryobacterium frigoriphilum]
MNLSEPLSAIVSGLDAPVLRVLSRTTQPLSGSRIAALAEKSVAGVRKCLGRLVEQGTVIVHQAGPSLMYVANREHLAWAGIQAAVDVADALLRELEGRIVQELEIYVGREIGDRCTLAVFGSVARGTSTPQSDLDLLVLCPDEIDTEQVDRFVDSVQNQVKRWTGNTCNILTVNQRRFAQLKAGHDPLWESWRDEARTFHGPELRLILSDAIAAG